MKKNNLFWSLLTFIMAAVLTAGLTSCGGDDDDDNNNTPSSGQTDNGGSSTEKTTDYTATTAVKTATLKYIDGGICIYEDYNYKYSLGLWEGKLFLYVYIRENGSWIGRDNSGSYFGLRGFWMDSHYVTATKSIGKVSGISVIVDKVEVNNINFGEAQVIQPSYGYAMAFTTEDGVVKYMRVYVKDYTLDSGGSLSSITIQYQLY